MKVIAILTVTLAVLGGYLLFAKSQINQNPTSTTVITSPQPSDQEKVDVKASFKIITNGTVRSFTNPKYHNRSTDVFITADDPSLVHVTKTGATWDDFFKTLPMKLTKECLTTGDGETFCDKKDGSLKFYLNDIADKDLLDKEIKQGDRILIKFI